MHLFRKYKKIHLKIEIRYFISNSFAITIILTTFPAEINSDLTIMAEVNSNEFDFTLLQDKFDYIHKKLSNRENERSKVCSCRNKPIRRHKTTYYCNNCLDKSRIHLGKCFIIQKEYLIFIIFIIL